jgi:hypothetical protein
VIGQIDRTQLINLCLIADFKTVIVGQHVVDLRRQFPRIPLIAVRRHQLETDFLLSVVKDFPTTSVEPFRSTVQLVDALIGDQQMGFTVNLELRTRDTVGITADRCA